MSENTINQRIAEMVQYFTRGNKSAFAKAVGISNQSLGEIVGARQSAPSFAALQKIALAYPNVDLYWLVLGEGGSDIVFTVIDEDRYHKLERLADELEDGEAKQTDTYKKPIESPTGDNSLLALRAAEEAVRLELSDTIEYQWKLRQAQYRRNTNGIQESEADKLALSQVQENRIQFEAKYVEAARNRIRAERGLFGFGTDSGTAVYRLGEQGEPNSLYDGLLAHRLRISNEAAERLVKEGEIRATYIDGEGYRVTEQAVRIFLGEFI